MGRTNPGGPEVHLANITVKGGDPAGIDADLGLLQLDSVTLAENRTGLRAGGLPSLTPVDIRFSRISGNQTGIRIVGAIISVFSVIIEQNQTPLAFSGFPDFGAAEIRNTTFRDNEGGISTDIGTSLTLADSAFIRNRGSILISESSVENRIENTTIALNETENGAISCGGGRCAIKILNSTITANRGRLAGGITGFAPVGGARDCRNNRDSK
jgi:hypothetical protein